MTAADIDLLEKHCPTCFIHYAAPRALFDRKSETGERWYCPNGHQIMFTESALSKAKAEAAALRLERDRLKQNEAWYADIYKKRTTELAEVKKAHGVTKRALTVTRKRVGHGVCPCCNRTFENLARHMSTKHADYHAEAA